MNSPQLRLTPRRNALISGRETEIEVLVSVAAPQAPALAPPRAPLNLAIVIDRSGSMSGQPLEEAKKCAAFFIDNLDASDRAAVVTFHSRAELLASSQLMINKAPLLQAVKQILSGGNTALHDGWLQGAEAAAAHVGEGAIARVLILTDGQANVGECDPTVLAADCARLAELGVSTSTYGLGHNFNEETLGAMADGGGGQAYYGESAEDLMDPFREEFDLLSALCARKLRLKLEPAQGVSVKVLNAYRVDEQGRAKLPDLAYGAVAWALLKVRAPADLVPDGATDLVHVLTAWLEYEDRDAQSRSSNLEHLRLRRVSEPAFAAMAEDDTVVGRTNEIRAADLLTAAREAARRRDWDEVGRLLDTARREAGSNEWVAASLAALKRYASLRDEELFSKEAYYSSRKKRSHLAGMASSRAYSLQVEGPKPGYLRRKPEQGKKLNEDPKN
jgi:Ca-activated chloride channel family protein